MRTRVLFIIGMVALVLPACSTPVPTPTSTRLSPEALYQGLLASSFDGAGLPSGYTSTGKTVGQLDPISKAFNAVGLVNVRLVNVGDISGKYPYHNIFISYTIFAKTSEAKGAYATVIQQLPSTARSLSLSVLNYPGTFAEHASRAFAGSSVYLDNAKWVGLADNVLVTVTTETVGVSPAVVPQNDQDNDAIAVAKAAMTFLNKVKGDKGI